MLLDVESLEDVGQLAGVSVEHLHALRQVVGQLVEVALARKGLNVQHKLLHDEICKEVNVCQAAYMIYTASFIQDLSRISFIILGSYK